RMSATAAGNTGGEMKPLAAPKMGDFAVAGFGLTLAVLLVGGVLGYVNTLRLADNERWVAHTHEVIGELADLLSTLKDAEPAAMKIVRNDTGKARMDDLRERVAAMRHSEEELLQRRAVESMASFRTTVVSILLPAVIGVVLLIVVFYL